MYFLAIIAALALERALRAADLEHFRRAHWFPYYRDQFLTLIGRLPGAIGPLGVSLICLLPTVLVWLA
ncbi:hypothetical protein, partial [Natronospira sp.]